MGVNPTRKRVAQACQRCRQRKFKCDGQKPECSTCKQAGQTCLYESHIRKRGLPEGYVRGMELLASLSIQHIKDFEGSLLSLLLMKKEGGSYEWQDGMEELLDIWRNSKLSFELENLLPSLPNSKSQSSKRKFEGREPELDNTPRRFAGPVSAGDSDLPFPGYDQTFSGGRFVDNHALDAEVSVALDTSALSFQLHEPRIVETRLPPNLGRLISIYFTHTHCWLPIVDKGNIMRFSFQSLGEGSDSMRTESPLAIIWAIAALTTLQISNRRDSVDAPGGDEPSATLAKEYYAKARELIPPEEGPFELEHVQALLIMSLTKICQAEWSSVWMLIGKAVRIAIDLDLGSTRSNTELQSRATEVSGRYKHTFLGCFIMDTLVSCLLNRTPHLRKEDADRVSAIQEDGLDEWDLWSDPLETDPSKAHCKPIFALSTFNNLVNVCKTLNFIHVAQPCAMTTASRVLLSDELRKGQTRQPFEVIFREPNVSLPLEERMLPHHLLLRLVYLYVLSRLGSQSVGPRGHAPDPLESSENLACYTECSATLWAYFKKTDPPSLTSPCFILAASLFQSHCNNRSDLDNIFSSLMNILPQSSGQGQGSLPVTGNYCTESAKTLNTHSNNLQAPSAQPQNLNAGESQNSEPGLLPQNPTQRNEIIPDSNSVFNDFVAIDTSEWCVILLTQFEDAS
ncbi:fungal-specific transcription factor domain-containing protein [Penicillium cataractarum]|uniref:Fungal-specific transcription factor domain-containing protein n=1 Tax=Penicillium cataractarum TaxID=2100454 RepID=A0A9W9RA44_9EURO|nr:fungal-specific transcription factor domain-containing protein [Penicillium cataractarum]KAJ5355484.1 fungal-specific transcription factor domain-containing protein [Penicillium cataractarum]